MFVAMKSLEAKALFALKLSLDANFLNKRQIEEIVNWFSQIPPTLEIVVVTEAKEFSEFCISKKIGFKHSWAGDDLFYQTTTLILGDAQIGKKKEVKYYDNGNYAGKDTEFIEPNFSIDQLQVVYVDQKNQCDYNNRYNDEETHLLVIYNPLDGYKISPEIKYILDNFKIQ